MNVLPMLGDDRICQIKEVPGLYISGRGPASLKTKLALANITHIVSVLKDEELVHKRQPPEDWAMYKVKQIAIDDDGNEDILIRMDEMYHWIDNALYPPQATNIDDDSNTQTQQNNRVLVHCRQGISRSGAFVVGYMMKKLSISYPDALALARASRPIISPNKGFEQQLQIYEQCRYDICLPTQQHTSNPGLDEIDEPPLAQPGRTYKAAYKVWKKERDSRLASGDGKYIRFSSMASMAAEFGRRRLEAQAKQKDLASHTGDEQSEAQATVESRSQLEPRANRDVGGVGSELLHETELDLQSDTAGSNGRVRAE